MFWYCGLTPSTSVSLKMPPPNPMRSCIVSNRRGIENTRQLRDDRRFRRARKANRCIARVPQPWPAPSVFELDRIGLDFWISSRMYCFPVIPIVITRITEAVIDLRSLLQLAAIIYHTLIVCGRRIEISA